MQNSFQQNVNMETLFAQTKESNTARVSQHRSEQTNKQTNKQTKQNKTKKQKKKRNNCLKGTAAKSRDLIYMVAIPITQTSTLSRDEHFYTENRAAM